MTTRSGREYSVYEQTMSERDQAGNSSGEPGLTQLLQALLTTRAKCHRLVAVYTQSSSILSFSSTDLQSKALYLYNKILKPVKLVVQVTIISFTEITGHE